ncbi:metal ABC transporter substrate-binding protein [bacterium]|nr:metal ABC transporter substrate-binding protein [bacterium]MBU1995253.1 metal ABC transporter substrate-binding protein [bacterium]
MMNFKNIIFVAIIIVFILQLVVMKQDLKSEPNAQQPLVALSTFSLYDIAKNISSDTLEVFMILPFGVDAHSFEPTPKLMADIQKSDLVVFNGAGLEPWTHGFEFKNRVINMSEHVKLRELESEEHKDHAHHDEHSYSVDPHYWLDVHNMIQAANIITENFIEIAPENKALYIKNRDLYIKMLHTLDADYKTKLSTCQKNTIIVNHNAFSYLANNYGFHVEALSGLSPEAEPNAKNMIKLIEHVKEHNISTVFFESFVSDKAIKSIAQEAKARVDVLQPLGNITSDEAKRKLSFEEIMRDNLEKISKALECK